MTKTVVLTPIKCNPKARPGKEQDFSLSINGLDEIGQFLSVEEFLHSKWFKENACLTADEVEGSHFWHDYYCAFITDCTISDLTGNDSELRCLRMYLDSDTAFRNYVFDAIKYYGRFPDNETINEFCTSHTIQFRYNTLLDEIYGQIRAEKKQEKSTK